MVALPRHLVALFLKIVTFNTVLMVLKIVTLLCNARLLESAGILPFSCQERRGDDSPGWRQARPTAVGWEGGWGYAVTGQLSDSVRRR